MQHCLTAVAMKGEYLGLGHRICFGDNLRTDATEPSDYVVVSRALMVTELNRPPHEVAVKVESLVAQIVALVGNLSYHVAPMCPQRIVPPLSSVGFTLPRYRVIRGVLELSSISVELAVDGLFEAARINRLNVLEEEVSALQRVLVVETAWVASVEQCPFNAVVEHDDTAKVIERHILRVDMDMHTALLVRTDSHCLEAIAQIADVIEEQVTTGRIGVDLVTVTNTSILNNGVTPLLKSFVEHVALAGELAFVCLKLNADLTRRRIASSLGVTVCRGVEDKIAFFVLNGLAFTISSSARTGLSNAARFALFAVAARISWSQACYALRAIAALRAVTAVGAGYTACL